MERINLSQENTKMIPVTINGTDIDMSFNASDMMVKAMVIGMADDLAKYKLKGDEIVGKKPIGEGSTKDLAETIANVRRFADEGIALCRDFSSRMAVISPAWAKAVGDNFVNLSVYEELIFCIQKLINDKETEDEVDSAMEGER